MSQRYPVAGPLDPWCVQIWPAWVTQFGNYGESAPFQVFFFGGGGGAPTAASEEKVVAKAIESGTGRADYNCR